MLRFVQRLFSRTHPLRLAAKAGDAVRYGQALVQGKLVIIHADLGERLPFGASEKEVLRIVEKAATTLPSEVRFFTYQDDGKSYFPFFLSQADAEEFCSAYSGREHALFAYQVFEVQGSAIARHSRTVDTLVMNAQCDDEFKVSPEWVSVLQALPLSNESDVKMTRLSICLPLPSAGT